MTDLKLTPASCRAARALAKWSTAQLVTAAGVSPNTVNRFEKGETVRDPAKGRMQAAFEARGIEILNGDAPGARWMPGADQRTND